MKNLVPLCVLFSALLVKDCASLCSPEGAEHCFSLSFRQVSQIVQNTSIEFCSTQNAVLNDLVACVESQTPACDYTVRQGFMDRIQPENIGYQQCVSAAMCDTRPLVSCFDSLFAAAEMTSASIDHIDPFNVDLLIRAVFNHQQQVCRSRHGYSLDRISRCYSHRFNQIIQSCPNLPEVDEERRRNSQYQVIRSKTRILTLICQPGCNDYTLRITRILNNCSLMYGGPANIADDVTKMHQMGLDIDPPCGRLAQISGCFLRYIHGCSALVGEVNTRRVTIESLVEAEQLCGLPWELGDVTAHAPCTDEAGCANRAATTAAAYVCSCVSYVLCFAVMVISTSVLTR